MKASQVTALVLSWLFLIQQHAIANGSGASAASPVKQSVYAVAMESAQASNQAFDQEFEIRREHFTSGRQLLLEKGVPFNPDELLKPDWPKTLKKVLDTIPEMREVRRQTAPMKGVVMADTLYLPERSEISGDTVILTKYLVFEGKNPVIKGPHDLHIFPAQPVAVLGTSLAEILHQSPGLINVSVNGRSVLPSFSLIQHARHGWGHITFNTSGRDAEPAAKPMKRAPGLRGVSLNLGLPLFLQSQDTSGTTGQSGGAGVTPPQSANGDSPLKAADGTCGSLNGQGGGLAGDGAPGQNGGTGGQGGPGSNAGNITETVQDGDLNMYSFIANGGSGGLGGVGGSGGKGGDGGRGGDGGNGGVCNCVVGDGGDAGHGGNGGNGGNGVNGGIGGTGGNGGSINVSLPAGSPGATTSNSGGPGGRGGDAGAGGLGGNAGPAGNPGIGGVACGNQRQTGLPNFGGNPGNSGNPGTPGNFGPSGLPGPTPVVTTRTTSTSGGGSLSDGSCLGGGTRLTSSGGYTPDCSPIVVDTSGTGFHFTSPADGVFFDIRGDGKPIKLAWTAMGSDNAFLALPGSDGIVANGRQLFGNYTPQPPSSTPNGFAALAVYDQPDHGGNGDGVIDQNDQIFSLLRLWIDANHDGICQPEELHRLSDLGVLSISLQYTESDRVDQFGNFFRFTGKVNQNIPDQPGVGRKAYDVFLVAQ